MVFSLQDYLAKLPLPATEKWPHGVWDIEAFKNGTMSVILYHPHVQDFQTTHEQDELYIVMSGNAELVIDMPPKAIPNTSGELAKAISEILLPEIVIPLSNPVIIPPLAVLFGETVLMRF